MRTALTIRLLLIVLQIQNPSLCSKCDQYCRIGLKILKKNGALANGSNISKGLPAVTREVSYVRSHVVLLDKGSNHAVLSCVATCFAASNACLKLCGCTFMSVWTFGDGNLT